MIKLTIGERFKDARTVYNQNRKQTTQEVKDATDISTGAISEIENDKRKEGPSFNATIKLAKHYGVSADYLLGLSDDPHRTPSAVDELGLAPEACDKIKQQLGDTGMTVADLINKLLIPDDDQPCLIDRFADQISQFVHILAGELLAIKNQKPDADFRLQVESDRFEESIQPFLDGTTPIPVYVLRDYWKKKVEEAGKEVLLDAAISLAFQKAEQLYDKYTEENNHGNDSEN